MFEWTISLAVWSFALSFTAKRKKGIVHPAPQHEVQLISSTLPPSSFPPATSQSAQPSDLSSSPAAAPFIILRSHLQRTGNVYFRSLQSPPFPFQQRRLNPPTLMWYLGPSDLIACTPVSCRLCTAALSHQPLTATSTTPFAFKWPKIHISQPVIGLHSPSPDISY